MQAVRLIGACACATVVALLAASGPVVAAPSCPSSGQPGADLAGANFDHCVLAGFDFSGANLAGANLNHANLAGASLSGATLTSANLDHANLTGANLAGVTAAGAVLDHANLSGANLAGAVLTGANLDHADLDGATLDNANLGNADLGHASFRNGTATSASFAGANLDHAVINGSDLTGADLSGTTTTHTSCRGATTTAHVGPLACAGQVIAPEPPVTVLTGLSQPGNTAAGPDGSAYFTQRADPNHVSLWVEHPGAAAPTQLYAVDDPGGAFIESVNFDARGDVFFVASSGSDGASSIVRLDRAGHTSVIATQIQTTDENGVSSGASIYTLAVAANGDAYFGSLVYDSSATGTATVYVAHASGGAPQELAQFGAGSGIQELAVTATGIVYALAPQPDGSTIWEIRNGVAQVVATGGTRTTGNQLVYMGVDAEGNVYAVDRTIAGPVCDSSTTTTTFAVQEYPALPGEGVVSTPTVLSQRTYPGTLFIWTPAVAFLRVSDAGDVYFTTIAAGPCDSPYVGEAGVIGMYAGSGQQVIVNSDSEPRQGPVPEPEGAIGVDPTTGGLYSTWPARGTLEFNAHP